MKRIVLDPGHGGRDPGAVGRSGVREKDINLAVAQAAARLLAPVAAVDLTRTGDFALGADVASDLAARARRANAWGADCFLSIHCNSASSAAAHGTETFCLAFGGEAELFARAVHRRLVGALGLADRGVKRADFAVLRLVRCPAALVELGFLSHSAEEAFLSRHETWEAAGLALAWGCADFLGISLPGEGLPPGARKVKVRVEGKELQGLILEKRTYLWLGDVARLLGKRVRWDPGEGVVYLE